jgi:hypothetical protein
MPGYRAHFLRQSASLNNQPEREDMRDESVTSGNDPAELGPSGAAIKSKSGALFELAWLQMEAEKLLSRAEEAKLDSDLDATHAAFQRYIARARAYLKATLEFNARFPESPFTLPKIVRPLVNALMVDADIVWALGSRAAADHLREQALQLSRNYLDH